MSDSIVTRADPPTKAGWLKKQGGRFTAYKSMFPETNALQDGGSQWLFLLLSGWLADRPSSSCSFFPHIEVPVADRNLVDATPGVWLPQCAANRPLTLDL